MKSILSDRMQVITALGIVQIFAWGSTYYLLAVLTEPILADTGWPTTAITAGISLGLLASGLVAMRIGRLIQTHGGRPVLAGAMLLIAAGLALLAAAPNVAVYLLAWVVIGVGMGAGLYDAAFSTLGRLYGTDARRAITTLTLWGGFASTVCWPISAYAVETLGWRGTCIAYAAFHLLVTLPLCLFVLPRQQPLVPESEQTLPVPEPNVLRDPRFWLMAVAGTTLSVVATVWSVHLISILQSQGVSLVAAVGLGMLIGPAQVGARVVEMASGGRHHPIWTMLAATVLVAIGFLGLLAQMPASAALIAYGAGNGIWSIARGALPLALFGAKEYPSIMGRLATPSLLASAAAPSVGAILLNSFGGQATLAVLSAAALLPIVCALTLFRISRRS